MRFRTVVLLPLLFVTLFASARPTSAREVFQLTIYYFTTGSQEKILDDYLQQALVPALHKAGIVKVGVFKALANDTSSIKKIYVLTSYTSLQMLSDIPEQLSKDKAYLAAGKVYNDAIFSDPPYQRMETIVLQAFALAPKLESPALSGPKKQRVYELRSYESATEKIFHNKVRMFNEGDEIGIFRKLSFNAIFYAEVLAGSHMPNLMYMTSFENMAERDAHWKSFGDDPAWKKLSASPEYQKNVSHMDISFLYPTDYSDL